MTAAGNAATSLPADADDAICEICDRAIAVGDLCATDIELGTVHAECMEGSPTVSIETGEPIDGPIRTWRHEGD